MSHDFVIRAYCRQVGKALNLPRKHKRCLLDGLKRELEEHFSDKSGLTLETLCKDAGAPEESAVALMDCVDERVRTQCWSRQKRLARLLEQKSIFTTTIQTSPYGHFGFPGVLNMMVIV